MRKFLLIPFVGCALATAASVALASDDDFKIDAPRDQWLTVAQIAEKFASQGYDVRKIEVENGAYEVYAVAKDGKRVETYVHPVTGEPLKRDGNDD